MVSGDAITYVKNTVGVFNILDGTQVGLKSLEKRRIVDVGRAFFPSELFVLCDFQGVPSVCALRDFGVS